MGLFWRSNSFWRGFRRSHRSEFLVSQQGPPRQLIWLTSIAVLPKLQAFLNGRHMAEDYRHCTDIGAVYLDIANLILALGLEHSILVELEIEAPSRSTSSGALLQIQTSRLEVYQAFHSESPLKDLKSSLLDQYASADAVVAALELIPTLWELSTTSTDILIGLAELYTTLCLERSHSEVHAFALQNLADMLDFLNAKSVEHQLLPGLLRLWTALPWGPINPSLSDAILRVSGCVMATMILHGTIPPSGLHNWGAMVADAGLDDKVCSPPFPTRR
jgi:hypothetical protein